MVRERAPEYLRPNESADAEDVVDLPVVLSNLFITILSTASPHLSAAVRAGGGGGERDLRGGVKGRRKERVHASYCCKGCEYQQYGINW